MELTLKVFPEMAGDEQAYVVVCKEHNIVAQGGTPGEAIERFGMTFAAEVSIAEMRETPDSQPVGLPKPPPEDVIHRFFGNK